ncbi:MAG: CHAT domain-containing protein [Pyrinomonadaceae bacterium]
MPRVEFNRVDLQVVIRREPGGGASVSVGAPGSPLRFRLRARTVARWLALETGAPVPNLSRTLRLTDAVAEWVNRIYQSEMKHESRGPRARTLPRITLDIDDPALAALAWEESFLRALPLVNHPYSVPVLHFNGIYYSFNILRVSQVLPRFGALPFTLPARILQLNPEPEELIGPRVRSLFGGRSGEEVARVVRVRAAGFGRSVFEELPGDWPTVDVLHLGRLPTLAHPESLLRTADPDAVGTLGWLSRRTDTWQTRLVVIETRGETELAAARRLGHALTARGGPAVLVIDLRNVEPSDTSDLLAPFYDHLIHDSPHDYSVARGLAGRARTSLFGGAGREDALRFSSVGLALMQLERDLSKSAERAPDDPDAELLALVEAEVKELLSSYQSPSDGIWGVDVVASKTDRFKTELGRLRSDWDTYWFEDHEREGVLPMAERLHDIRLAANVGRARARETPRAGMPWRYVNSSLWEQQPEGALRRLPQKEAFLTVGETYQLRIQVGPQDAQVETVGAAAIIEEVFKWSPEMRGVWLEVGVSGIDFDVAGAPVQELWLPRGGASDPVFFAVVPRRSNVACLRFSVYLKQNVIQSFCLAALTRRGGETREAPPELRRSRLARALKLEPEEIGDFGYLPRLEYSTAANIRNIVTRPERGLSIVANEVAGRKTVTLKGKEIFAVQIPKDLKDYVAKVRATLKSVSTPPVQGVKPENLGYAWGLPGRPNAGKSERLEAALKRLAEAGWQLFDRVIPGSAAGPDGQGRQRDEVYRLLEEGQTTIHVAHTLLEDVLPWGALYDRMYDPDRKTKDGEQVAQGVCLAALPSADGELPFTSCGVSKECLLHAEREAARRQKGEPVFVPETVACPLHFWGFKHLVEVPAQQVSRAADAAEQQDCILPDGQVQLAVGYNQHFAIYQQHLADLDRVTSGPPPIAVWKAKKFLRDDVVDMLKDATLDFVYLYCHAYASREENFFPPFLEFGDGANPARIRSDQLDHATPWLHHPLVFLNGCGTGGFNPEAISPFIEKFVRDRGAAGVIGTEIPVWEQLASEFAYSFMESFLKGDSAGRALLRARHELLAKNNPLGLVYTLYGPAHLKIAKDGKCTPNV